MEYKFLEREDGVLLKASELPVEDGIAVAVYTTGYTLGADEVLQISIVDFSGNELMAHTVKPQNIEVWSDSDASRGITPADVTDAPELYQFEDEIIGYFEKASVVVGLHMGFIGEMIESSWVSLPPFEAFDLDTEFCASHSEKGYPGKPAAVVTLRAMANYYGLDCDESTTTGIARTAAQVYKQLVTEHMRVCEGKGNEYWEAYERKLEEKRQGDSRQQALERMQAVKTIRVNAILWLCAAAIFSNLAVQLNMRGFDFGFIAIASAAAIFFAIRWVMCLYSLYKLRNQR